MMMIKRFDTMG
jgi:hypothetical protein